MATIANFLRSSRPSCPIVLFKAVDEEKHDPSLYSLRCKKLNVYVDCYISTAVVSMDGTWKNKFDGTIDATFLLPTRGTVRSLRVDIGENRVITTSILPRRDAETLLREQRISMYDDKEKYNDTSNDYIETPNVFRFPIKGVRAGETIQIHCEYAEILNYYERGYWLSIPLTFQSGKNISSRRTWEDVVDINCSIYPICPTSDVSIDCMSHNISAIKTAKAIILTCLNQKEEDDSSTDSFMQLGRDFELAYAMNQHRMCAFAVNSPALCPINDSDMATFSLLIAPSKSSEAQPQCGKAIFFLIDRSGSMAGAPFRVVKEEISRMLTTGMKATDEFGICLYDHLQMYWGTGLLHPATDENVRNASLWMDTYVPERGGRAPLTPIQVAMEALATTDLMPYLVVICSGSTHDEREICEKFAKMVKKNKKNGKRVRTAMIGIGPCVNESFLSTMSSLSGCYGHFKHISEMHHLAHDIRALLTSIQTLCLSDLEIAWNNKNFEDDDYGLSLSDHEYLVHVYIDRNCKNVPLEIKELVVSYYPVRFGDDQKKFEIYPFPLPDLYAGSPVVVSVRYKKSLSPQKIAIRGYDHNGEPVELTANMSHCDEVNVESIMMQQIVDIFAANAWMKNSKKLEWKNAAISCALNIPSRLYTITLAMETTRRGFEAQQVEIEKMMGGYENNRHVRAKVEAKMRNNKEFVASTGSMLTVVGVAPCLVGYQGSLYDNWPVFGGDPYLDAYGPSSCCCICCWDPEWEEDYCECDAACEYYCCM